MKPIKTENWFETGFQQLKTGLPKKTGINIPNTDPFPRLWATPG